MPFYNFEVKPKKEWGDFHGLVFATSKDEAETKIINHCVNLGIEPDKIGIRPITRVPKPVLAMKDYYEVPRVTMSLGEGTVAFGR